MLLKRENPDTNSVPEEDYTTLDDRGMAFLDVQHSCTGRRWVLREAAESDVASFVRYKGLSEVLARILVGRGLSIDTLDDFLQPGFKRLFPDPSSFADMDKATDILFQAFLNRKPIVVFADYDVDGATASALLVRWFRAMGHEIGIYVPDREKEGYGPTPEAFGKLKQEGVELVITVDCGATAEKALEAAADLALRVVVIDHHLMMPDRPFPPAVALVNPNRPDCGSGQGKLAAAGVVFVLLASLNRKARQSGLFTPDQIPDIRIWLDLVALGSLCDVTELRGFNRALVIHGLKVLQASQNPGLQTLSQVSGVDISMSHAQGDEGSAKPFTKTAASVHAGFILGPRINAGGRIGRSDIGARLLATDNFEEARILAQELQACNEIRKQIEAETLLSAKVQIEQAQEQAPILVAWGEGWRPGVVGIVASRLKDMFRKPALVIGVDPQTGLGRGSGRSQPGIHLGQAVQAAVTSGLLRAGGGHAMAAGLTVEATKIPDLQAFLINYLAKSLAEVGQNDHLEIDGLLRLTAANRALWMECDRLAPFGSGNPEILFALADVKPERVVRLKGDHVRCDLRDRYGQRLKAIAFRAANTPLGVRLLSPRPGFLHVVGRLKPDDWQGQEKVQFEIEDLADPKGGLVGTT